MWVPEWVSMVRTSSMKLTSGPGEVKVTFQVLWKGTCWWPLRSKRHGEAVGLALGNELDGFEHNLGSEEVKSPDTVVGAPSSPVRYGCLSHGIASG